MNNYMQQIADMLGVELGEVFLIKFNEEYPPTKYVLTKTGLYQCNNNNEQCDIRSNELLGKIITGDIEITKRPWKPQAYESYFKAQKWGDGEIHVDEITWSGKGLSCNLIDWKVGNCFKTKEEAELKSKQIIEQIESEYRKA